MLESINNNLNSKEDESQGSGYEVNMDPPAKP